jgi:hypothetical protein
MSTIFPFDFLVPDRSHVITLRESIVMVAGENILYVLLFETWSGLSK